MDHKPSRAEGAAVDVLGLGFGEDQVALAGVPHREALREAQAVLTAADGLFFTFHIEHIHHANAVHLQLTARQSFGLDLRGQAALEDLFDIRTVVGQGQVDVRKLLRDRIQCKKRRADGAGILMKLHIHLSFVFVLVKDMQFQGDL